MLLQPESTQFYENVSISIDQITMKIIFLYFAGSYI